MFWGGGGMVRRGDGKERVPVGEQVPQLLPKVCMEQHSTEDRTKANHLLGDLASQFPMLKDNKQSQPFGSQRSEQC